ncbi:hypothetical protein LCGC14_1757050 [marine sediment metagenome]|uniref:Uncharacterized protein n=1 Tax=marine sediment metagenome TaxID=412755 RepID=A0A0F9JHA3_9ZZZZ
MVFDSGKPEAGIAAKLLDDRVRVNNEALQPAFAEDHAFPNNAAGQTGRHNKVALTDVAGDEAGRVNHHTNWNDAGTWKARSGTGAVHKVTLDGDVIPAGTKMWFYKDTAPTNWTIDGTVTGDELLAVKKLGTVYTPGGGTGTGATWTQPNHTHAVGTYGVVGHTHDIPIDGYAQRGGDFGTCVAGSMVVGSGIDEVGDQLQSVRRAGAALNTSAATAPAIGGASAAGATANTWRPVARVGIICTKDAY